MIKSIVDHPEDVNIKIKESESSQIFELQVGDGDLGKVIGKKGRNVGAIRTILSAATAKEGSKKTGIKKFTAMLEEPIVLAGDEYTALSTIRDSEVHQDLSFELKM